MTYKHVRVAVRCALLIEGEAWVHVDPNSKKSKDGNKPQPALWWFGGVIAGESEHRAELEQKFGAKRFEGDLGRPDDNPNDWSCWILQTKLQEFQKWVYENVTRKLITETAMREIAEEFKDFGLPKELARKVQCGASRRLRMDGRIHTYTGEPSDDARCYTYVVKCKVPPALGRMIKGLVADHEDLYLITSADVKNGHIQGVVNGVPGSIVVPKMLEQLFK